MSDKYVSAEAWAKEVCQALGLDSGLVTRLVVDIRAGELPRIYVEGIPGQGLALDVKPPSIEWIRLNPND